MLRYNKLPDWLLFLTVIPLAICISRINTDEIKPKMVNWSSSSSTELVCIEEAPHLSFDGWQQLGEVLDKHASETAPLIPLKLTHSIVQKLDLRTSSGITAEQLEKGLKKNLKGKAHIILQMEKEYQVNAYFIAAVAAQESGWGTSSRARNKQNYFGYGNFRYNDFESSVRDFCEGIDSNYLTPGGKYYRGKTVSDVNIIYCPSSKDWAVKVKQIMVQLSSSALS